MKEHVLEKIIDRSQCLRFWQENYITHVCPTKADVMWTGNILANTNVLQAFEVQDCPPEEKKGKGVFAKKRIFKGEFVGVYDGDYIDKKESERRSLEYHMV